MTADEFNETFALCHFLPGPNIVNLSMVFGSRLRGIAGGAAAFTGLLLPPTLIMTVLAIHLRPGSAMWRCCVVSSQASPARRLAS